MIRVRLVFSFNFLNKNTGSNSKDISKKQKNLVYFGKILEIAVNSE